MSVDIFDKTPDPIHLTKEQIKEIAVTAAIREHELDCLKKELARVNEENVDLKEALMDALNPRR